MSQWWDELFALHNQPMKYNLANITTFLEQCGNPQHRFRSIHIVGTNGKGSTACYLSEMIMEMGYKTGCYTSPHLYSPLERITINHQPIDENYLRNWYHSQTDTIRKIGLSFFEIFTGVAFQYFADQGCEWVVCEAGLGGRLDATNVIAPQAVVITPISLDHQNVLGTTIEEICHEKIAVIKPGVPVFMGRQSYAPVEAMTETRCREMGCDYYGFNDHLIPIIEHSSFQGTDFSLQMKDYQISGLHLSMPGEWQADNAATACLVIREIFQQEWHEISIRKALARADWPGRLQKIIDQPLIYADVSHNPDGLKKTLHFIHRHQSELPKPVRIIFSALARKEYRQMVELLQQSLLEVKLLPLNYDEGLNQEQIEALKSEMNLNWEILPVINYKTLLSESRQTWFIMGSHYLLAETIPGILREYHHLSVSAT